jgi:hypothetical protein
MTWQVAEPALGYFLFLELLHSFGCGGIAGLKSKERLVCLNGKLFLSGTSVSFGKAGKAV